MLEQCAGATTDDKPLLVNDSSADFGIIIQIIIGRGLDVVYEIQNWAQARRLFSTMESYKLHAFNPWFSQICQDRAAEEPWEAIFLACNQAPFDKDLIMTAMIQGFKEQPFSTICKTIYYKETNATEEGGECWSTLLASNIKPRLGIKLGLRGALAYQSTFNEVSSLAGSKTISWHNWADKFVRNMSDIEEEYETVCLATRNY